MARRAAAEGTERIVGYARSQPDANAAAEAGAIHEVAPSVEVAVRDIDLVVLAAPPKANMALLADVARHLAGTSTVVTDVSSVKGPVAERAVELGLQSQYAGSHPLAGTHESGFEASRGDLFDGAIVYVTPVEGGERARDEVTHFWKHLMGADPVSIEAHRHDELVAWTSHLPQTVASALAVAMAKGAPSGAQIGPGARSTTRLAGSSAELWTDILMQNRDAILPTLQAMQEAQAQLREALERRDEEALCRWLERGATWRSGVDA